jgi:hypothetical protein
VGVGRLNAGVAGPGVFAYAPGRIRNVRPHSSLSHTRAVAVHDRRQGFHSRQGHRILFSTVPRSTEDVLPTPVRWNCTDNPPESNLPGQEDDHSPPQSSGVKIVGAVYLLCTCLLDVARNGVQAYV